MPIIEVNMIIKNKFLQYVSLLLSILCFALGVYSVLVTIGSTALKISGWHLVYDLIDKIKFVVRMILNEPVIFIGLFFMMVGYCLRFVVGKTADLRFPKFLLFKFIQSCAFVIASLGATIFFTNLDLLLLEIKIQRAVCKKALPNCDSIFSVFLNATSMIGFVLICLAIFIFLKTKHRKVNGRDTLKVFQSNDN